MGYRNVDIEPATAFEIPHLPIARFCGAHAPAILKVCMWFQNTNVSVVGSGDRVKR